LTIVERRDKDRQRRKEGKEESNRKRRNNLDAHGTILWGGWRRKETYGGKILPIHPIVATNDSLCQKELLLFNVAQSQRN
jgi:hypothetical protein